MKNILLLAGSVVVFSSVFSQLPPSKNPHAVDHSSKDQNHLTIYAPGHSILHEFYAQLLDNPAVVNEKGAKDKGSFIAYHESGQKKLYASYKKGKLNGDWVSWYGSGLKADSGRFVKNVPDGEWKSWYPNGATRSVRNYDAKKLQYVMNEMQRPHPKASFYGMTEIARNDKNRANQLLDASFRSGNTPARLAVANRVDVNTDPSNNDYHPPYSTSLLHGEYANYFPNGAIKDSGYYKYGLREGAWIEASSNGTLSKGMYHKGIRKGPWKYYDRRNKFLYHREYDDNGKLQGE